LKGKIKQGHFHPFEPEEFREDLEKLEGQVVEVSVKKYKKDRSIEQHRYYRVILRIISQDLGYEEDEVGEILKAKFLKEEVEFEGQKYIIIKSTTALKTDEFADYIEKIKRWASMEHGIFIPEAKKVC